MDKYLSFTQWLARAQNRDSALGDLARDVAADSDWPGHTDTCQVSVDYLTNRHACDAAITACRKAWKSYKAYLRNHPSS